MLQNGAGPSLQYSTPGAAPTWASIPAVQLVGGASGPHVTASPPHTPHASNTTLLNGIPSQPVQPVPSPPHTPQASYVCPLPNTPSQPAHVELSPPHTPQLSY